MRRKFIIRTRYNGGTNPLSGLGVNHKPFSQHVPEISQKQIDLWKFEKEWRDKINDTISYKDGVFFKPDWDGDNCPALSEQLFKRSTEYMYRYMKASFNRTGNLIPLPDINPVGDNSLDFEWHTDNFRLLINFKYNRDIRGNKEFTTSFYGDNNHDKYRIKATITGKHLSSDLIVWLDNLAK